MNNFIDATYKNFNFYKTYLMVSTKKCVHIIFYHLIKKVSAIARSLLKLNSSKDENIIHKVKGSLFRRSENETTEQKNFNTQCLQSFFKNQQQIEQANLKALDVFIDSLGQKDDKETLLWSAYYRIKEMLTPPKAQIAESQLNKLNLKKVLVLIINQLEKIYSGREFFKDYLLRIELKLTKVKLYGKESAQEAIIDLATSLKEWYDFTQANSLSLEDSYRRFEKSFFDRGFIEVLPYIPFESSHNDHCFSILEELSKIHNRELVQATSTPRPKIIAPPENQSDQIYQKACHDSKIQYLIHYGKEKEARWLCLQIDFAKIKLNETNPKPNKVIEENFIKSVKDMIKFLDDKSLPNRNELLNLKAKLESDISFSKELLSEIEKVIGLGKNTLWVEDKSWMNAFDKN